MKVTYLVTCSTETDCLKRTFDMIVPILGDDYLLILKDENAPTSETDDIIQELFDVGNAGYFKHPLSNDYGGHKNFGIERSKGDFIFQIDGDENPPEALLGENLHALLEANPDVEAYAVPRINDFRGVTPAHARQWGWRLSESPSIKRPVVNWPDHQWRIFKIDYPRISFTRRLHEKIEGYMKYVILPSDEEYALYHDKTIETQVATNLRYNKLFTQDENKGHNPYK